MKETYEKIKNSIWTPLVLLVFGSLILLDWIVFPFLTASNSILNIIGAILIMIIVAVAVVYFGKFFDRLDKKREDEKQNN